MGRTGKAFDVSSVAQGSQDALRADPTAMKHVDRLTPGQGAAVAVEFNTGRAAMLPGNDVPGVRAPVRNGAHEFLRRALAGGGENAVGGFITRRADSHWDISYVSGQLHGPGKTIGVGRARWPRVPVNGPERRVLAEGLQGAFAKHVANATGKKVFHAGQQVANPTRLRWYGGLGVAYHYPTLQHNWTAPEPCNRDEDVFCDGDSLPSDGLQ